MVRIGKTLHRPVVPISDEHISDFYFLDSQRGWALFSRFNKDESDEDKFEEPKFDLASTTDAGATWTKKALAASLAVELWESQ